MVKQKRKQWVGREEAPQLIRSPVWWAVDGKRARLGKTLKDAQCHSECWWGCAHQLAWKKWTWKSMNGFLVKYWRLYLNWNGEPSNKLWSVCLTLYEIYISVSTRVCMCCVCIHTRKWIHTTTHSQKWSLLFSDVMLPPAGRIWICSEMISHPLPG